METNSEVSFVISCKEAHTYGAEVAVLTPKSAMK